MYISKVRIKNFRVFDAVGITAKFKKGVNAIIGENNSGKTAFIDALRLAFSACSYKKDIYFSLSDFHVDISGIRSNEAQFDIYFDDVSPELFEIWLPEDETKGEFHIRFYITPSNGSEKIKYEAWGGTVRGNNISADTLEAIKIAYFGALRDAENELKPTRFGKLGSLFNSITKKDSTRDSIVSILKDANKTITDHDSVKQVNKIINYNLSKIEREILSQRIGIGLIEPRFETIAASLRAWFNPKYIYLLKTNPVYNEIKNEFSEEEWQISTEEVNEGTYIDSWKLENKSLSIQTKQAIERELGKTFEISQNGLGYNNLLFMAVVLGDIVEAAPETLLSLLLIEEPESHLHPQLQELVHRFLVDNSDGNKVQAIYTSHSPTLVSRIGIENLVLLYENAHRIDCLSFSESNLCEPDRSYLEKYFDVTKSQMLFAKGIILVEGISEALLLPEFARLLERPLDRYAVEVVNIDGVAFKPFANLLTFANDSGRQTIKSAIITDDDRCTNKADTQTYISSDEDYNDTDITGVVCKLKSGKHSERFIGISNLCDESHIKLCGTPKTLEYALASSNENIPYMLSAIIFVLPQVGKDLFNYIEQFSIIEEKASCIWLCINKRNKYKSAIIQALVRFITNKKVIMKNDVGDFVEIVSENSFVIPANFKEAIYYVTRGADSGTDK